MREAFRQVQHNSLEYEDSIVWLVPINGVTVVDKVVTSRSRNRKPSCRGKIVGYSILFKYTPNNGVPGQFFRRVFLEQPGSIYATNVFPGCSLDNCAK